MFLSKPTAGGAFKGVQELFGTNVKKIKNTPKAALKDTFLPSGKGVKSQDLKITSRNVWGDSQKYLICAVLL